MSGQQQLLGGSGSLLISLRQRLEAKHALHTSAQQQQAEDDAAEDAQQYVHAGQHEEEHGDDSKHRLNSLST